MLKILSPFFHKSGSVLVRGRVLAVNLVLLGLWVWLFHPVYPYLRTIFTRQEFRTNQIVLLAVLALIVVQARRGSFGLQLGQRPQLHFPGLALALLSAAGFVASESLLDINTLSATLFGLASYGLLGLWIEPPRWRQGLPAALLLIGVLPFGEHMDTFIGYPLRLVTARGVSQGLAGLGYPNLGVDTILVFENGLSQVDNPCSGVKSLWTGGLFFLAATWIERRPVNRRWLLAGVVFAGLLVAANFARVAVLVLVGQALGLELLAEMLHVPLGVIGFTGACAAVWGLLRLVGNPAQAAVNRDLRAVLRPGWLAPALGAAMLALALLTSPRPQPASAAEFSWKFPAELNAQPWDLSQGEMDWLTSGGALQLQASRWRFEYRDVSGSILMVKSDTWRAHHHPERCFTVYGLEVQGSQPYLVAPDFPLLWLTLGLPGDQAPLYSAGYWLQSKERVTEDYSVRIWDDLAPQPEPWVLVTVLFDKPVDPQTAQAQAIFGALHAVVQESFGS